jgi:hypothetical protein
MAGQNIDRDKLRAAIRKMGTEYVFLMLDDAITLLPQGKLRKLIQMRTLRMTGQSVRQQLLEL